MDYTEYEKIKNDESLNFYDHNVSNKGGYTWQKFEAVVRFEKKEEIDPVVSALIATKLLQNDIYKMSWFDDKSIESRNDQLADVMTDVYMSALTYINRWDPDAGVFFDRYFKNEVLGITYRNRIKTSSSKVDVKRMSEFSSSQNEGENADNIEDYIQNQSDVVNDVESAIVYGVKNISTAEAQGYFIDTIDEKVNIAEKDKVQEKVERQIKKEQDKQRKAGKKVSIYSNETKDKMIDAELNSIKRTTYLNEQKSLISFIYKYLGGQENWTQEMIDTTYDVIGNGPKKAKEAQENISEIMSEIAM